MTNYLKETTVLDTFVRTTEHVARLREKGGQRTILVKFTVFVRKNYLEKTLAGSKNIIAEDLCLELKNTRRYLIPNLKDAKGKLEWCWRICGLETLKEQRLYFWNMLIRKIRKVEQTAIQKSQHRGENKLHGLERTSE
jgi:hypothetical protein